MRTRPHFLLVAVSVIGCTEYKFHEAETPALPGEDTSVPEADTAAPDSGEPGSCADWAPSAPGTSAVDDACVNAPEKGSWSPVVEWQWQSNG